MYNNFMVIHVLPDEVASQIAAGEVIERPASVVKELLENSIDAQASNIQIKIEGAGTGLIELADDGVGIDPSDMQLAVARHATSKLTTAEDLLKVKTLGFRGEALASIGSVSHLAITSRVKREQTGFRIRVDGGQILPAKELGSPEGTLVRVEDLFYNVPVRRKFLKTERTERRHIVKLVSRYALAYPKIRMNLLQENRKVLNTNGKGDRREVISNLYGVEIAKQMIQVFSDEDGLKVTGFISPTSLTRSNRNEMQFFVNGRPIQDSALSTALIQAYHTMLMVGRFPMAILFLELPPEMVDVNVHPAKSEVRFRDQNQIFRGVGRAARKALLANTPVPNIGGAKFQFGQSPSWQEYLLQKKTENDPAWVMSGELNQNTKAGFQLSTSSSISGQKGFPDVSVPLLRLIGQVAALYLVAEGPDGLYLIDQHAAHERVLYEKMMVQLQEEIPVQTLLTPVTVELPQSDSGMLEDSLQILIKYGFQVESFGKNTFLIRGLPSLFSNVEPSALIRAVVDRFDEDESPLADEVEAKIISRVCKRAAVKAGQILSQDEQEALLRDLENCEMPRTCPHGRPTMIHLSVDLLARQFGRQ
jgi:DNA mismatch repair protein MutL